MIVKNEEDTLAACLESVVGFATELIIVDTGSTDRTVEIARSFGARVEYFPWIDDFAAARNESIKYATGEWVFWMDADDRLLPGYLTRLKQALVSNQADVYSCSIISETTQHKRARVTAHHFRLFRNHLGLYFEYPLHENLAIAKASRPITIAYTNILVDHIGYVSGEELFKAKTQRNLAIVRQCLIKTPDNLRWHFYLGLCLSILGEYKEAIQALEFILVHSVEGNHEVDLYYAHLTLASLYVKVNRLDLTEQTLKRALTGYSHRQHLLVSLGMFYLDQDRPEEALIWLEQASQTAQESLVVQGYTWLPGTLEECIGQAQLLLARPAPATVAYQAMLAARQEDRRTIDSALRQQAQRLLAEEDFSTVIDILTPVALGNADALRWLVQAEWQRRDWTKAVNFLTQVISLDGAESGEWVRLATGMILKTGQIYSARRLCLLALACNPSDAAARSLFYLLDLTPNGSASPTDFWQMLANLIEQMLGGANASSARITLQQIAELFDLPISELIRQHGLRLISQKAYQAASEAFALLVNIAPADTEAYKSFGVALQGLGHQEEALIAWQVAQQITRAAKPPPGV